MNLSVLSNDNELEYYIMLFSLQFVCASVCQWTKFQPKDVPIIFYQAVFYTWLIDVEHCMDPYEIGELWSKKGHSHEDLLTSFPFSTHGDVITASSISLYFCPYLLNLNVPYLWPMFDTITVLEPCKLTLTCTFIPFKTDFRLVYDWPISTCVANVSLLLIGV